MGRFSPGAPCSSTAPNSAQRRAAYNQAGQLKTATTTAGAGSYTYDGTGLRASKTAAGVTTHYTWGSSPAGSPALLTDGTTDYLYGPGGLPLEQTSTAAVSFYVHDQLGSTIALTSTSGAIAGPNSPPPASPTPTSTTTPSTASTRLGCVLGTTWDAMSHQGQAGSAMRSNWSP